VRSCDAAPVLRLIRKWARRSHQRRAHPRSARGRSCIERDIPRLRECRLWHAASDDAVGRLAAAVSVKSAPAGAVIAAEGDPADAFGVVVRGSARVVHLAADGRRSRSRRPA